MKGKSYYIKIALIGILAGLINGLFGSGGGTILVPAMTILLMVSEHEAHGTAISIILPLVIVSSFVYLKNDIIDWNITWKVAAGGIIGGYVGAKLMNILPPVILRKTFAVFMVVAAVRMIIQ